MLTENPARLRFAPFQNYGDIAEAYNKVGERGRIGHNTVLVEMPDGIGVRLHQTVIVTFHPDNTVTLNSGRYRTVTTKARMNSVLPPTLRVDQTKFEWFVREVRTGESVEFFDGMRIKLPYESNPGDGEYGVFKWRGDGKYRQGDAVKVYKQESAAEKYAAKLNETGEFRSTGGGFVVRTMKYIVNPRHGGHVTGYLSTTVSGTPLVTWEGKRTGWEVAETVKTWRTGDGEARIGVMLRRGKRYAGGLWLADGGTLFRGEVLEEDAYRDRVRETIDHAEYWLEIDSQDEQDEYEAGQHE